jgi:hypothetical protein
MTVIATGVLLGMVFVQALPPVFTRRGEIEAVGSWEETATGPC